MTGSGVADVDMCASPSRLADPGCEHSGCRSRSAYIESVDNIKVDLMSLRHSRAYAASSESAPLPATSISEPRASTAPMTARPDMPRYAFMIDPPSRAVSTCRRLSAHDARL